MQNPLTPILEKEMDRKEFLVHVGAGLLVFLGLSSIFKALSSNHSSSTSLTGKIGGYGGSGYGR